MYVHLLLCSAILGKPYKSIVISNNNNNIWIHRVCTYMCI